MMDQWCLVQAPPNSLSKVPLRYVPENSEAMFVLIDFIIVWDMIDDKLVTSDLPVSFPYSCLIPAEIEYIKYIDGCIIRYIYIYIWSLYDIIEQLQ